MFRRGGKNGRNTSPVDSVILLAIQHLPSQSAVRSRVDRTTWCVRWVALRDESLCLFTVRHPGMLIAVPESISYCFAPIYCGRKATDSKSSSSSARCTGSLISWSLDSTGNVRGLKADARAHKEGGVSGRPPDAGNMTCLPCTHRCFPVSQLWQSEIDTLILTGASIAMTTAGALVSFASPGGLGC